MQRARKTIGRLATRVRPSKTTQSSVSSSGSTICQFDPNARECPLIQAAHKCDYDLIENFLGNGHGPGCMRGGGTALHVLLRNEFQGHLKGEQELQCCAELLINYGCNVNQKDDNTETPLSLAVHNKFVNCVDYLIIKGADMTVRTTMYKKKYSLAVAIAQHMPEVFEGILDDAVTRNPDGVVTIDWGPMLQIPMETQSSKGGLSWLLGANCETGFLYELLDIPKVDRDKYLNHALVMAFMYLKKTRMFIYLTAYQLFMALFTVLYLVFLYIMYFDHCRTRGELDDYPAEISSTFLRVEAEDEGDQVVSHKQRCSIPNSLKAFGFILVLIAILLLLKEILLQLRTDSTYLKNWTTWVTWIALLLMGFTLWPAVQFSKKSYNFSWHYPVASVGAFCAGILFLVHFELIPKVKMYLEQIVIITLTVFRIILLFTPIFVGLYVGFNITFFAETRLMNFMLMSIDAGSDVYEKMIQEIADDGEARFFIVANIFCIAFILIIAIVFMNYLLAAAIQDYDDMKATARIVDLSKQVETLYVMEVFGKNKFDLVYTDPIKGEMHCFNYKPSLGIGELSEEIRNALLLLLQKKMQSGTQAIQ